MVQDIAEPHVFTLTLSRHGRGDDLESWKAVETGGDCFADLRGRVELPT
ncbi:MAG: hypothetical protein OXE87_10035 [Chloroflexi bacterium]|nr:hypothetical protein [Chloroflexota bacterium]